MLVMKFGGSSLATAERLQQVVALTDAARAVLRGESVVQMRKDIARFIGTWLPCYVRDNRSYLTVGIGCTGGQHRSVYFAEWLGDHFRDRARVLVRHRELSPEPTGKS